MGRRYRQTRGRDPYWLRARYPGSCSQCNAAIKRDDRIFYYPNTRTVFCAADDCGGRAARDFDAAAFDERVMSGSGFDPRSDW